MFVNEFQYLFNKYIILNDLLNLTISNNNIK